MPKMEREIKILMVDDDEEDFIIVRELLSEIRHYKYSIDWARSYAEGLQQIEERKYDVYLVDYRLGPESGLELIRNVLKNGYDIPLILLTGQNDIEVDKQAMKAGASDFLVKGAISSGQLERSIRYSIEQSKNFMEIKYLNSDLEKKVIDRTMILEKALSDLDAALAKEKELNELKSRFVSMASHEFRTPLTTILSSVSLIKKYGKLNQVENQERHAVRIESAVENLIELLNDFLSLGKLEEGMIAANPEEFNLNVFVSEVLSEMSSITQNGQKINYTHSGPEAACLDKKLLKNILLNLTSNAIKFSQEGKTIDISSEIKGSTIKISVEDSGIGISKADQEHLFSRFFRGHNATNIQGTGLGLNIVSKYIELMNGSIEVDSEENKGTTFTVTFPQ